MTTTTTTTTCEHIERTHALADGQLTGSAADDARDHLADCDVCQAELADALQLDAAVMEAPAHVAIHAPKDNVVSLAWYRRRSTQVVASAALAAAAGLAIFVAVRPGSPSSPEGTDPKSTHVAIALAPKRGLEARVAWSDASAYRPYDVPRGDAPKESIPLSTLGDVEKTGDLHGVGVLALLDGDRKQAATYFDKAGDGVEVQIDRAALALNENDASKALGLVDAVLEKQPHNPAALWNKALALRDLGLNRAAAAAFREVADQHEKGWADEAIQRAKSLDATTDAERDLTIRVLAAGPSLAKDGTGLSLDDARKLPGFSRLLFYDALRAAPTAERIAKLRPLAEAIDQATHSQDLVAAIERAKPRGKLAETYGEIIAKQAAGDWEHLPAREPYLAALRAAKADDLLIGALIKLSSNGWRVMAEDLPELDKLTTASPDVWMYLLGIEQQARVAIDKSDVSHIESTLLQGRKRCANGAPAFRCMKIEMMLADTYAFGQRQKEARAAAETAWKSAHVSLEWLSEIEILSKLAQVASLADDVNSSGLALVRAYTEELRRRGADEELRHSPHDFLCEREVWGRYRVANTLISQLRFADAKAEIARAPSCKLDRTDETALRLLTRAYLVDTASSAEREALRTEVDTLRKMPELSVFERALLDHVEARTMLRQDPKSAEALLRRSIDVAKSKSGAQVERVVGWGYSLLAISQALRNDGAGVFETLSEAEGVKVPARCAVALAAEMSTMTAIRDANGKVTTSVRPRTPGTVTLDHADLLAGCDVVDVLARSPFHGQPRLLPKHIAWRYLSARKGPIVPATTKRHVVVADVEPPASLGLPHLATWSPQGDVLSGPTATPSNVLAAMSTASEVTIHAHGIVDQTDSSYLALSTDSSGHYALTEPAVRAAHFATSPIVVLAACHASQATQVMHESWSLPTAFIYAGARAVIAAASPIPDAEAAKFFDDLDQRIAQGASLALALRDSRQAWRGGDWVNDLMVFE